MKNPTLSEFEACIKVLEHLQDRGAPSTVTLSLDHVRQQAKEKAKYEINALQSRIHYLQHRHGLE